MLSRYIYIHGGRGEDKAGRRSEERRGEQRDSRNVKRFGKTGGERVRVRKEEQEERIMRGKGRDVTNLNL